MLEADLKQNRLSVDRPIEPPVALFPRARNSRSRFVYISVRSLPRPAPEELIESIKNAGRGTE